MSRVVPKSHGDLDARMLSLLKRARLTVDSPARPKVPNTCAIFSIAWDLMTRTLWPFREPMPWDVVTRTDLVLMVLGPILPRLFPTATTRYSFFLMKTFFRRGFKSRGNKIFFFFKLMKMI